MPAVTIFEDVGMNRSKIRIANADTKANIAAWHTFLQGKVCAKVVGTDFITEHAYDGTLTAGKYNNVSVFALGVFYYIDGNKRRPLKFALHAPVDSAVEYDADRGKYRLTAAAGETMRAAIETVAGLDADSLVYVSGYLYDKQRRGKK
jgi:hypothetical protein